MIRHFVSFLFLSLSLSGLGVDFDGAVDRLVGNNLSLQSEALRGEAAVESLKADNVLSGPEVDFTREWGNSADVGDKLSFSVSQSFDWPGLYKARREAARTASSAYQFLREANLLDSRREARELLLEYIHNAQVLNLQKEIAGNIDNMVDYYKRAAEEGLETRIDYNKTVIERIAVHRELHNLESEREGIVARLQDFNAGLDVDPLLSEVGVEYPEFAPVRLQVALSLMRERDPGYAAAKAQAEAAGSLVKVERLSAYPGFSIGFVHETEGAGATDHFNGFSIGLTLPSWSRRHSSKAARLEAEAAVMEAEMALHRRKAELVSESRRIESLRKQIDEYAPVVADNSNYELLKKALKAGQITFLTYIEELNYFIAAHREYLDLLYEYNLAIVRTKYYD